MITQAENIKKRKVPQYANLKVGEWKRLQEPFAEDYLISRDGIIVRAKTGRICGDIQKCPYFLAYNKNGRKCYTISKLLEKYFN